MVNRKDLLTVFVQKLTSQQLHGLVGKLNRLACENDLSEGQEFLWRLCIYELEQRRSEEPHPLRRCSCQFCFSPFEDPQLEAELAESLRSDESDGAALPPSGPA
jgi:hypothetical protein